MKDSTGRGGKEGLRPGWILSRRGDLMIFTGPVLAALLIIWVAAANGSLHREMPPWLFALLIISCDVAHVYATAFRVYLDPERFKRRPGLFVGVPLACFTVGVVAYGFSAALFWRLLAYLAVWHFVRQQWGWVSYTRAKAGEGSVDRLLDQWTIYTLTVAPIVWWHAAGPREFHWFVEGDFASLPRFLGQLALVVHWSVLALFLLRQVQRLRSGAGVNWAKLQVVAVTWVSWYVGIVVLNSDIAFTALNVLSHGVPYLAVVWAVERGQVGERRPPLARWFEPRLVLLLLAVLVIIGYSEEWLWDALVWHEHDTLFGRLTDAPLGASWLVLVVPLLALPQATHYVLDGYLWRRSEHDDLGSILPKS